MSYRFDSPLKARVVAMIMEFWGIRVRAQGQWVHLEQNNQINVGFDFFAGVYDGVKD